MLRAERLLDHPIIGQGMDDRMGSNINGPCLIRVPDWVPGKLGRYYLYFAHHRGQYIRLAYADALTGPWTIHGPGVLPLEQSGFSHHVASPEVVVDHDARRIRMFYHGGDVIKFQYTRLASSADGLDFTGGTQNLMNPYARIFRHGGWTYAIAMPGQFYRSRDGVSDWQEGPCLFTRDMRHAAVRVVGDTLTVIWSNRGDAPESLWQCEIDLSGDWMGWSEGPHALLLAPERDWEGAGLPVEPSVIGPIDEPANQLRDPALFDEDGQLYMVYAVAGEWGLALAALHEA
ncbi:hypothetical protein C4N9_08495 [Pararhodobacter marinus]|uniref:Glycosyl hydrolase family 43 n=1 Tax=Pararhodobacter marinus TaxID=2184063 RepID=A0A2U2CCZ9_9RHOB|nr:hypothetical protein [Pararhodobacter marinus]PWE29768.1 hypothetical protein C4N9_08495 [Pararhodobacter marinus]